MPNTSSSKKRDGISGGEIFVLVVLPLLLVVGMTAYTAAAVSGLLAHGHLAHDQKVMPFVGWGFVGLGTLVHATDPARAWPKDAGVGPAALVWVIFVVFSGVEILVASRTPFIRRQWSRAARKARALSSASEGSGGMGGAEAKRHNERLRAV